MFKLYCITYILCSISFFCHKLDKNKSFNTFFKFKIIKCIFSWLFLIFRYYKMDCYPNGAKIEDRKLEGVKEYE